jgi:hypothetical protein
MHVCITATRIKDVYVKAIDNFAHRMRRPAVLDLNGIVNAFATEASAEIGKFDEVPLNGLPAGLRKRVKSLESLVFAEFLLGDREHRRIALEMILREWLASPLSVLPLKILLRRTLPVSWVSRVVKFKKKSRPDAAIVAN